MLLSAAVFTLAILSCPVVGEELASPRVEFGRDIRPLLSNHCFACHGPDEGKRKAGLRLDTAEGATTALKTGHHAIVPGSLDESEIVRRITHESPKRRMPPEAFGKPLAARDIELLQRWIEQGAEYQQHWSFAPPARPEPPAVRAAGWPRGAIDRFLLARMEAEGLKPAPEASRETWLRRVALDLTGLPPTPDELDAFLADAADDADGVDGADRRAVRRLLQSPRYGEQMARTWLDLARYGDTHGYHLDNERSLWRWREWVIDAFQRNLPFDQFTVEQLAGDLLPDATVDQRLATGFLRCNPTTGEGGLIEEEYLVKYVVDRVNTTSSIWLGLTVGCAQCHDHKFDPITQRDYYGLFAFFHNIAERGTDDNALAPAPSMKAPLPQQAAALAEARGRVKEAQARLDAPMPEVDAAQARWEEEASARLHGRWQRLEVAEATSTGGTILAREPDGSLLATGANPPTDVYELTVTDVSASLHSITALKLEALGDPRLPLNGPGRYANGNFVLTGFEAELVAADGTPRPIRFDTASADHAQENFPLANALDGDAGTGWAILPALTSHQAVFVAAAPIARGDGERLRVRLKFESQFAQHAIGRVRLSATGDAALAPVALSPWRALGPFTANDGKAAYATPFGPEAELATGLDFSRTWANGAASGPLAWTDHSEWTDGQTWNLTGDHAAWYLARSIDSPTARSVTLALGSDDALKVWCNGRVLLDRYVERSVKPAQDQVTLDLKAGRNWLLLKVVNHLGGYAFHFEKSGEEPDGLPLQLAETLAAAAAERTEAGRIALRDHYRRKHAPQWRELQTQLDGQKREEARLDAEILPTMVAEELAQPRMTTLLVRGQYDRKGDPVAAAIPALFGALPPDAPKNRLGFARWLVARDNPLTARVFVNRLWQQLFGIGLVKTAEDFGAQGEWPVHRELLDWLAVEFMESGFDVHHLLELLVTSAAYRQSAAVSPALLAQDRDNRLLARGPRFRVDAEVVRDCALFASGLLVERIGGRSVKPYQPGDLWKVVGYPTSNTASFVQDHGESLWRRSLYTFWKRTSPPPNLTTFDAPSRESCTIQRARTNTPLQALVLLNDVQFVEAARKLAERMIKEGGATPDARASFAFRWCTSRRPAGRELRILTAAYERELARFRADPEAAAALLRVGEAPVDAALEPAELAAWTVVASTILNLDETITKG